MADLAQNVERAINNFDSIRAAIIEKGQDIPANTPVEEYAEKISKISGGGGGWERPSDRPEIPVMTDNMILMLFGVGKDSPNDMAFLCTTSTGQYKVDWGDGTSNNYNTNVKAEHLYDFAAVDKPIDSQGYKMVWITVTPITGNIATFNNQQRHSLRPAGSSSNIFVPQVFEMYIQCPYMTGLIWSGSSYTNTYTQYRVLEIFSLDINDIAGAVNYYLLYCYNLKQINKLYIEKASSVSYFMYSCYSYNQPFPEDVTFANVTTYFMQNCYSYNQPFPEGVTFEKATTSFMYGCYSYNQPFPESVTFGNATGSFMNNCYSYNQPFPESVTFGNATTGFMYGCYSYNQPFPEGVTFPKITDSFMNSCYSYNHSVTVDLAGRTTAIGTSFIGTGNHAQKGLRLLSMGTIHTALTVSNSSMDVPALVALFGDLADRTATTTGTITITNCFGAARLTAADRAIATAKNWTITG